MTQEDEVSLAFEAVFMGLGYNLANSGMFLGKWFERYDAVETRHAANGWAAAMHARPLPTVEDQGGEIWQWNGGDLLKDTPDWVAEITEPATSSLSFTVMTGGLVFNGSRGRQKMQAGDWLMKIDGSEALLLTSVQYAAWHPRTATAPAAPGWAEIIQQRIDYHDEHGSMAEAADMPESAAHHDALRKELQALLGSLTPAAAPVEAGQAGDVDEACRLMWPDKWWWKDDLPRGFPINERTAAESGRLCEEDRARMTAFLSTLTAKGSRG